MVPHMWKEISSLGLIIGFVLASSDAAVPSVADKGTAELSVKLNQIILPDVSLSEVSLDEGIDYLRLKSRELDQGAPLTHRGVNFVLLSGGEKKPINLKLQNMPLGEVLRFMTEPFAMKFTIEPHAVVIRSAKHTILNPVPARPESALEVRLQKMIIPTVNFQDATIEEAVEYLRLNKGCDPPEGVSREVNVILKTDPTKPSRTFSIDLKGVPRGEALRYLAEMAGLKLGYHSHAVVISPVDQALDGQIQIVGKGLAKAQADRIILKVAEFQNATIREVIQFVQVKSREQDPAKLGVSIAIGPGVSLDKTVDLSLKQIPVSELLRYCAEWTGHRLSADDRTFVLSAK